MEFHSPGFGKHPVWMNMGEETYVVFSVRACQEAFIYLAAFYGVTEDDAYEIVIGAKENSE